jgi:hypothetical protein
MKGKVKPGQRDIAQLIAAYINGNITAGERLALNDWLNEDDNNRELFLFFTNRQFLQNVKNARWN